MVKLLLFDVLALKFSNSLVFGGGIKLSLTCNEFLLGESKFLLEISALALSFELFFTHFLASGDEFILLRQTTTTMKEKNS